MSCGRQFDWTLIPEYAIKRPKKQPLRVDGALVDRFNLARAFWEAKDSKDDLKQEVQKKFKVGYPKDNIIFQQLDPAILYQDGKLVNALFDPYVKAIRWASDRAIPLDRKILLHL